ncbi:hypothetical protein IVA86_00220 [Bradyrhizobium sp. 146]|uniref:hypothetical protein n=1 Tax=Bradyrhizobium sp. 146 TaxID=2782622 RepID=UPI001FF7A6B9|nr:hypothetical protein [Bradyrhizobium sp. 146]MCK1699904.1 hypothetical protein [Bradyrhizobium sp. 146]
MAMFGHQPGGPHKPAGRAAVHTRHMQSDRYSAPSAHATSGRLRDEWLGNARGASLATVQPASDPTDVCDRAPFVGALTTVPQYQDADNYPDHNKN